MNISSQSKHRVRIDTANRQVIDAITPSLIGSIRDVSTGDAGLYFNVDWDFGRDRTDAPIISRECMFVPTDEFDEDFFADKIVTVEVTRLFQIPA